MLSDNIKSAALKLSRETKYIEDIEYKGKKYSAEVTLKFDVDYQGSEDTGWSKMDVINDVSVENVVVKDEKGDVLYDVFDDNDLYDGVKGSDIYSYIRDYAVELVA